MKIKVISTNNPQKLRDQLQNEITGDFKPSLAVVFTSPAHPPQEIAKHFSAQGIDLFGGTTAGEIADNRVLGESIVAMLLAIDKDTYTVKAFPGENTSSFELGDRIGRWTKSIFSNSSIMVMSAGLTANGEQLIEGITRGAGTSVDIYGGLSGDDLKMSGSFAFSGKKILANGVLVLAFNRDKVQLKGLSVSGWKGLGTPKRITKAQGNVVTEIDGEPATEVYRRYFQIEGDEKEQFYFAGEYPLRVIRDDGSAVIRNVMYADVKTGAITYGGTVPQGARVQFASPDIANVVEQCVEQINNYKTKEALDTVDGIILFSCAARHASLGRLIQKEVELIRDLWPAPLIGFFSYGEIGKGLRGKCEFNNNTITLIVLREARSSLKKKATLAGHERSAAQIGFSLMERKITHPLDQLELDPEIKAAPALFSKFDRVSKEKQILLNFLHRTSEDLERAMEIIELEREKSEKLLLNVLPQPIAERLKKKPSIIADHFGQVSISFSDIVDFTTFSNRVSPEKLVSVLNNIFGRFDTFAE